MATFNHYSFFQKKKKNHYSCVTFFLYLYLQVLAKLEKFKTKVSAKETPTPTTVESKHANDEELTDWSSVTLKFSPGVGKVCFLFSFHHMKSFHFPSYEILDIEVFLNTEYCRKLCAH